MNFCWILLHLLVVCKILFASTTNILENAVVHEGGINLNVGVKVPVALMGLENEGDVKIDAKVLATALHSSFPMKSTPLLDESRQPLLLTRGTKVAVDYDLSYAVLHLPSAQLVEYESRLVDQLAAAMKDGNAGPSGAPLKVDASQLEEFFERMVAHNGFLDEHELLPGINSTPLVLILYPNLARLQNRLGVSDLSYQYYLDDKPDSCAEAWISKSALLVLDLASAPCHTQDPRPRQEIMNTQTTPAPKATDLVADAVLSELLLDAESAEEAEASPLVGSKFGPVPVLVNAIISALKNVLLPDLTVWPHDMRQRLICPILLLSGDKLSANTQETPPLDLPTVQKSLKELSLPGQETVVLLTEHTLHDHPQVATALMKSYRTRRVYHTATNADEQLMEVVEESYFDGPSLLETMRSAGDILANHVFQETGAPLLHLELQVELGEEWEEQKTQILPIYVFRVADFFGSDTHSNNFFEDGSPVFTTPDAVLVLQDDEHPDATAPVVAGLASSLFGLSPPHMHFTSHHGFETADLLWAKGYHPFPAFGFSKHFSDVFFYSAGRNIVVARMLVCLMFADDISELLEDFVNQYLPVPILHHEAVPSSWSTEWAETVLKILRTSPQPPPTKLIDIVNKVHGYLQTVIKDFNDVYKFVNAGSLDHATDLSAAILSEARVLFQEVQILIGDGTVGLACCERSYVQASPVTESTWMISLVFLAFIFVSISLVYHLQMKYSKKRQT